MPDSKISDLAAVSAVLAAQELAVADAGTSRKVSIAQLEAYLRGRLRAPDVMIRPGIFGEISICGAGGFEIAGTPGQERPAAGSVLSQQFRYRLFGNAVATDDAATAVWAWDSLNDAGAVWRGDASGLGGFRVEMVFCPVGLSFIANPMRGFFGLRPGVMGVAENPVTSAVNCVGVAFVAAAGNSWSGVNLSLIHNDGSGAPTEVALGSDYPVKDNLYRLVLEATPNASSISYLLQNLTNGQSTSGSLSTNIPAATAFMAVHAGLNKQGSDDGVFQFDLVRSDVWLLSPYA